jgi:PAS domain S-box-containing protein
MALSECRALFKGVLFAAVVTIWLPFHDRKSPVNANGTSSLRALVLAPNGRDAPLIVMLLKDAGFEADICPHLGKLNEELRKGAGLAIIADEALERTELRSLVAFLSAQPAWSDIPVILLTHRGGGPERNPAALRLAAILGNVSFLERPFHPITFTTMVRAAARGRRRQYDARGRLDEISEREQQLHTALTAGRLGSWNLDVKSMTFHLSETSRNHFGSTAEAELPYERLMSSVHPDDRPHMNTALDRALKSGDDYVIEFRNVRPGGELHWVEVRARSLKAGSGSVVRLVGVSSDISDRKRSELERERLLSDLAFERTALSNLTRTLEQRVVERTGELMAEVAAREKAQEQLLQAQKMESVGQLTGGIAHDFNNLLMAVMGNLEILRKRLPDDPNIRRLIDGAQQGAQRGASLTQRMLVFARQQDLRTTSADLGTLVLGMQELLRRSLGPNNALRLHIEPRLPPAEVDPHQVELAILNLAINARDAMPDGGAIELRVDQKQVTNDVERLRPGTYVRIQIADTGTGMDQATLSKAIEPFFSTKPLGKGTGLGLSMTHGLAVQLGGLLELASELGKGTTATLWLPQALKPAGGVEAAAGPASFTRTATILVVDDDPLIATSTIDMLEDLGHTVIGANSGAQALEIINGGERLDLLMTDQAMPDMTGIQLAEIVRRTRPDLPVLLATGYTDLPAGKLANLPRLSKPYQQAQLQAEIEKLLSPA